MSDQQQPPSQPGSDNSSAPRAALRLKDVRAIFRLVGEIRELGADPNKWRPHMITRLGKMMKAEIVVSSEIHFRATRMPGIYKVHDIGWGCDQDGHTWQINTEREEKPEAYWLSVLGKSEDEKKLASAASATTSEEVLVPVAPKKRVYGGTSFILSQFPLPHLGAVDQLGIHRAWGEQPFTQQQHRLVRLFHVELGRVWKREAIKQAQDPSADLPPRLAQTLAELAAGSSEKQVSMKLGISRHTVHNYVKALHKRLGVSSRGELLAKAGQWKEASGFTPKLSVPKP